MSETPPPANDPHSSLTAPLLPPVVDTARTVLIPAPITIAATPSPDAVTVAPTSLPTLTWTSATKPAPTPMFATAQHAAAADQPIPPPTAPVPVAPVAAPVPVAAAPVAPVSAAPVPAPPVPAAPVHAAPVPAAPVPAAPVPAAPVPAAPVPAAPVPAAPVPAPPVPAAPVPTAPVAPVPAAPAPVAAPVAAAPVAPAPVAASVPAAAAPAAAAPVAPAPATAVPAVAAPAPVSPSLPGVVAAPAVAPAALAQPGFVDNALFAAHDPQGTQTRPPSHRIQNALGSVMRTLVVAVLIAGAVIGGRFGYQWYQDREAGFIAELPTEPVAPPDARFVSFTIDGATPVSVSIDLMTGDAIATTAESVRIARSAGSIWLQSAADAAWVPATDEALATHNRAIHIMDTASLRTVTDVLPVEMHEFLSAAGDETVLLPGSPLAGDMVLDIGDAEPTTATDDTIRVGGNSDEMLVDVVDNIANPVADQALPDQRPLTSQVVVRELRFSLDGAAFAAAHPHAAAMLGPSVAATHEIVLWLDRTGVVRKMTMPAGLGDFAGVYTLTEASALGESPLAGIDLTAPVAVEVPAEEAQS